MASLSQTPTYQASAQVWVDQKQGDQQTNLAGTVEGLQTIILTMIHAIDSRPVAEKAIGRLGLQMSPSELLDNLTIEQVESTSFIVLTYESNDPEEATRIVNTVGQVSSELISERSAAGSQLTANVYEEAALESSLSVEDNERMLQQLAAKGYLEELSIELGRLCSTPSGIAKLPHEGLALLL